MFYIASTALIVIGLLCAIGEWYEKQTMSSIYGSMIIQVVGVFEYFLAKVISKENSSFYVKWLNTIIIAGSLTLAHSQNSQMSFMYGFFFVKFLFFTVVCVVIVV